MSFWNNSCYPEKIEIHHKAENSVNRIDCFKSTDEIAGGAMKTPEHKVFLIVLTAIFISCASSPLNKFGHHHDYPYKAPDSVNPVDEDECSRRADRDAFAAIRELSTTPGLLFGAIGATVQLIRANSAMNSAYEKSLKTCLRDKGYGISE
jgi:hypothetical protein